MSPSQLVKPEPSGPFKARRQTPTASLDPNTPATTSGEDEDQHHAKRLKNNKGKGKARVQDDEEHSAGEQEEPEDDEDEDEQPEGEEGEEDVKDFSHEKEQLIRDETGSVHLSPTLPRRVR